MTRISNEDLAGKVYNKVNAPKREEVLQNIKDLEDGIAKPKRNTGELDKDAFLNLLTTQLANQDPLSPMEDREFIAQLAQFSSLEQMTELNKTFTVQSKEMIDALDYLNLNQMQANAMILKQMVSIKNGVEKHLNIDLDGDGHIGAKPGDGKENNVDPMPMPIEDDKSKVENNGVGNKEQEDLKAKRYASMVNKK